MKYLKYFKIEAERSTYKSSSDFVLPNVNYVEELDSVDFNPVPPPPPPAAGDIVYYKEGSLKTVKYTDWKTDLGTPVGVITIPEGFAPDGKARMVALSGKTYVAWGGYGTDTSLTNYNRVPTTDNTDSTTTGSAIDAYLPSNKFTRTVSYVDPGTRYSDTASTMIPSPYLTVDGKNEPNPAYYAEISGYNNALSDFNGLENTKTLVELDSANYPAANHCWIYKDAANSSTQWYLPAMGELGYMLARFNEIKAGLAAVSAVQLGTSAYWSSSECSSYLAYEVDAGYGHVTTYGKGYNSLCALPWAIVE